ncbi:terpene synthase family protein [Pendulispora rubella]|uniref:Terpene synthase n=1 Tax=Pendulispora rubella TaxID=2741070 RepID=A0ABZ2LM98_9BACT
MEEHLLAWVKAFDLAPNAHALARFRRARLGELAARTYPSVADITRNSEWLSLLFLVDERFCNRDNTPDRHEIVSTNDELLRMLPMHLGPTPAPHTGLAAALAGWWRDVGPAMSLGWRLRFVGHAEQCFRTYEQDLANERYGIPPPLRTYVEFRRQSGAAETALDLIEFAEGAELPEQTAHCPQVHALRTATNDIVCWTHDLLFVAKERARGRMNNLVAVLWQAWGGSWQDSAERAAGMIAARYRDFAIAEDSLCRRLDAVEWEHVERAVRGYRNWISGSHEWHLRSPRYIRQKFHFDRIH